MDVNDNYRSWDDDLVAGSLHPIELFEYFHVLRKNNWQGVWQLDQFPFREDSVETANHAIDFLKAVDRGLDALDVNALKAAQDKHDAITALRGRGHGTTPPPSPPSAGRKAPSPRFSGGATKGGGRAPAEARADRDAL